MTFLSRFVGEIRAGDRLAEWAERVRRAAAHWGVEGGKRDTEVMRWGSRRGCGRARVWRAHRRRSVTRMNETRPAPTRHSPTGPTVLATDPNADLYGASRMF